MVRLILRIALTARTWLICWSADDKDDDEEEAHLIAKYFNRNQALADADHDISICL